MPPNANHPQLHVMKKTVVLMVICQCAATLAVCGANWGLGSDSFASAPNLSASEGISAATSLEGYWFESNEPGHRLNGATGAGRTAWWRWTAPRNGWVCIHTLLTRDQDVSQPLIDTTLAVYSGSSLSTLVRVAANERHWLLRDALSYLGYSSVAFYATQGAVYRVAVDGRQSGSVSASARSVVLQLRQLEDRGVERRTIWGVSTAPEHRGQLTLRQTGASAFSAVLTAGRRTFRFSGQFDIEGYYRAAFPLPSQPGGAPAGVLQVEIDGVGQGALRVSHASNPLYGGPFPEVLRFSAANPNPLTGYYTATATGGTATATVVANGLVRGTLRLPDGSAVPFAAPLLAAGGVDLYYLMLHRLLRQGSGYVHLRSLMRDAGAQDDWIAEGSTSRFYRAPNPGATFLPAGVDQAWGVAGGTYTSPVAGSRPFGFLNPNGNGKLTLSGGELTAQVVETLVWGATTASRSPTRPTERS